MTAYLAPNGMNVYRGAAPNRRVLVGTTTGIVVLDRDSAGDWHQGAIALDGHHISSFLLEPKRGGLFAGVHRGGVHFSADGGKTWEERSVGIGIPHVYTLGCTTENGEPVIYAGSEPAGLFRSADYGLRWQELPAMGQIPGKENWNFPMPPHIAHLKTLAFDPRQSGTIYAGVEQGGLFKTSDGGRSWRELDRYARPDDAVYKDIHQIVMRPGHPDEIFMTGGMGLYHSKDGGETWQHLTNRGFRIGYPDKLLFAPHDDCTMFMCGSAGNPGTWRQFHTADAFVMISRDLGQHWSAAAEGLPDPMKANIEALCMFAWPGGFSLFAGTTDGDVFCRDGDADRWRKVYAGLAPVSKVAHFRLLLAGAGGPPGQAPVSRPPA